MKIKRHKNDVKYMTSYCQKWKININKNAQKNGKNLDKYINPIKEVKMAGQQLLNMKLERTAMIQ